MRRNNDLQDLTKEKYEEKKFLVFKKNRKKKKEYRVCLIRQTLDTAPFTLGPTRATLSLVYAVTVSTGIVPRAVE